MTAYDGETSDVEDEETHDVRSRGILRFEDRATRVLLRVTFESSNIRVCACGGRWRPRSHYLRRVRRGK
jgi:hypothetical protein